MAAQRAVLANSSLEKVGVWCLLSYILLGPYVSWLRSSQEVICTCTSFDHSDGRDVALPTECDKDDLEKNNKTAEESHTN